MDVRTRKSVELRLGWRACWSRVNLDFTRSTKPTDDAHIEAFDDREGPLSRGEVVERQSWALGPIPAQRLSCSIQKVAHVPAGA